MPSVLANFFQKHLAQRAGEVDAHIKSRRSRLSAAALLVEVVKADGDFNAEERRELLMSVQSQFSLTAEEAADLLVLAEAQTREATDLHQFTTEVNKHFTPEQKLALIEELWRAAYADAVLHRHEEYLVRKIADLLHVPNISSLAAKQRAQNAGKKNS